MAASVVVGVVFTTLYFLEAFFLFASSIHGASWLFPLAFVFIAVACTHIWRMLLTKPKTKPLGRIVGSGLLIALIPPAAVILALSLGGS